MGPKDVDRMANSVDPDQTTPLEFAPTLWNINPFLCVLCQGSILLTALFSSDPDDVLLAPEPTGFTQHPWLTCHIEEVQGVREQVTLNQRLGSCYMFYL